VDRITRKELKQDRFALEVGHTLDFLGEHRAQAIRYGAIALVVVLLVGGFFAWRRHQARTRQEALSAALEIQSAPVGPSQEGIRSYPTAEAKDKALTAAFADLAARYPGTNEGVIAQYYLGAIAVNKGDLAQAEKQFRAASEAGSGNYEALASRALADVYAAEGKTADAEKILRNMMEHPTAFVSKNDAQLALARVLIRSNPAEARKLLQSLQSATGAVSEAASETLAELNTGAK